jgi:ribosomal protein S6--L-glutamate ligase
MRAALLSYDDVLPDAAVRFREAAHALGIDLVEVPPHELQVVVGPASSVLWREAPLDVDAVLHRTVSHHLDLVGLALQVLEHDGVAVLNPLERAIVSRDKGRTLAALAAAGIPVVPTIVAEESPLEPAARLGDQPAWVVKPARASQGLDVRLVEDEQAAARAAEVCHPLGPWLVQPYVEGQDLRTFVVGGRCMPVMRRVPGPGEWRANLRLGGTGETVDGGLAAAASEAAAAAVAELGLDYAAVDLFASEGPGGTAAVVSEVDAWGGFVHLERTTGADVAAEILRLTREVSGA